MRLWPWCVVMVLVAACASERGGSPGIGSDTAAATGPISSPAPRVSSPESARPSALAHRLPCQLVSLRVGIGPYLGGMSGEHSLTYTLTNASKTTCMVGGYPTITLSDRHGVPLKLDYVHGRGPYVTHAPPQTVTLAPGAIGYFLVAQYRCDVTTAAAAAAMRIQLPGQSGVLTAPTARVGSSSEFNYCVGNRAPDPGDTINVSPIDATPDALVPLAMR